MEGLEGVDSQLGDLVAADNFQVHLKKVDTEEMVFL